MGGSTIWLVGMMGVGKTSVGRALADLRALPFVDSDDEIEREAGSTVSQLFSDRGEPAFRELERSVIARLAGREAVVALGGGAIAQPGMAERLGETGRVVYLRAPVETLLARVGSGASRPLLADLDDDARRERLAALLADREIHYGKADLVVNADEGSPAEVAQRVDRALRDAGQGGDGA